MKFARLRRYDWRFVFVAGFELYALAALLPWVVPSPLGKDLASPTWITGTVLFAAYAPPWSFIDMAFSRLASHLAIPMTAKVPYLPGDLLNPLALSGVLYVSSLALMGASLIRRLKHAKVNQVSALVAASSLVLWLYAFGTLQPLLVAETPISVANRAPTAGSFITFQFFALSLGIGWFAAAIATILLVVSCFFIGKASQR